MSSILSSTDVENFRARTDSDLSIDTVLYQYQERNNVCSSIEVAATKYFAEYLDSIDDVSSAREKFLFPPAVSSSEASTSDGSKVSDVITNAIYLCGNSLGLQPKSLKQNVISHLDKWANQAVEGHFTEPTPWLTIDDIVNDSVAKIVGALTSEVVTMNSLTCNLHLMMAAFYRPKASRNKILIEAKSFPSDIYAVTSQIIHHGFNPSECLLEVFPRDGESCINEDDIEKMIIDNGETIALVLFSGVQYYTGQLFDMARITRAAHQQGSMVGFDLAHAIGNVPLHLHQWGCDFACWCNYKYMNCGPGAIGGCFVHEIHGNAELNAQGDQLQLPRLAGWWGHRLEDRFTMGPNFVPCTGAYGFRLSNPPVLLVACLRASLDVFDEFGMDKLRRKSILLTGYLELLLRSKLSKDVEIITPADPKKRGCQLSLSFPYDIDDVLKALLAKNIICDARKPNVIRIAPTPLYNSFSDVLTFITTLQAILLEKK